MRFTTHPKVPSHDRGDPASALPAQPPGRQRVTEIERCWCDRWPQRCTNRVTQEDMRCDLCRRGCGLLVAGDWSAHVGEVSVAIEQMTGWEPSGNPGPRLGPAGSQPGLSRGCETPGRGERVDVVDGRCVAYNDEAAGSSPATPTPLTSTYGQNTSRVSLNLGTLWEPRACQPMRMRYNAQESAT
jgi:hypothetical protein